MTTERICFTTLAVFAMTLVVGLTAQAQVPKDLAQASTAFIQKAASRDTSLGETAISRFQTMVCVPADLSPFSADAAVQTRLNELKEEVLSSAVLTLDAAALPKSALSNMVPLAQKLAGQDCFVGTADTPVGAVLLKATYGWLTLVGIPAGTKLDPLTAAETGEYETGEAAALDKLDTARYALTLADLRISENVRPSVTVFSSRPPLVLENEQLSADARAMHYRALAFIRALVSQKLVARFHWRVKELPFGVYGESVISFRPPARPDYAQSISCGYSIHYVTDGTLFAVAISRHADVFPTEETPKQARGDRAESLPWFTEESTN